MISEKLLQFIWKLKYFDTRSLTTVKGEEIKILEFGKHNQNQGPDFLNAKIEIENTILVGNIEMHITSKDWFLHNHQNDANYNNIILHIVWEHNIADTEIKNYPVLELKNYVSKIMLSKYEALTNNCSFIPCENSIKSITTLQFNHWKDKLLIERLEEKTNKVLEVLAKNKGSWEETFWQKLAFNFGLKVNSNAFEEMAISTPSLILAKNKLSHIKIESLLMGQANLLNQNFNDDYALLLQKEYNYLANKYSLQKSTSNTLFLRMRPYSFPTIRLSQLANLIFNSNKLFSKVLECKLYKEVMILLHSKANDYWHYHYKFEDDPSDYNEKYIGVDMQHNIIINTIVPIVFAYGIYINDNSYKQKALKWLEDIPTEKNSIIKKFRSLEIISKTAADSQSLIQLYNKYCNVKKCLECSVGVALLKK